MITEIKSAPINQISQAKDVNSSPEYISLSNAQHFDWFTFAENTYLVIACSFFTFSIWQLFKIISHTKNVSKNVGGLKIIYKKTCFTNCSFFNYVFIDHETITEAELNVILKHEQVHANQLHSVDKIVMMVFKALLWFNPIIYLYNKALEESHEFEADEITSLRFGNGTYANLLLKLATDKSDSPLVHNFVKSPIKERIKMLFNPKSKKMKKLVYLFSLPICFSLFWLFSLQSVYAQVKVVVNPDGTHSAIIDNGKTKTVVNPDGTHSTIIDNGKTKTVVNPDGTHSTIIDNGKTKTVVNPDGTHSTIIDNGKTKTVVNPDGTHSTIIDNGKTKTVVNPDGTHSTIIDNGKTKTVVNSNGTHSTIIDHGNNIMFDNINDKSEDYGCKITKIECDDKYTIVSFQYKADNDKDFVTINKEIYIQTDNTNKHFEYVKADNIPVWPTKRYFEKAGEKIEFKIYFEKVPITSKSIDIIERAGRSNYFNFYDIKLPASYNKEK